MGSPQQLRPSCCVVSREESARVDAFVMRYGRRVAAKRLGIGAMTLDAAADQGRMLAVTKVRLLEALDREEGQP